ncbi:MAG: hypothetical protein ACLUOI_17965 [Eisenbergiella sp.]
MLTTVPGAAAQGPFPIWKENEAEYKPSYFPGPALWMFPICRRHPVAHTAVDTLVHLIESHLNTNITSYSRIYSEMGLRPGPG